MNSHKLLSNQPICQNIIDALPVLLFWTDRQQTICGNNKAHAHALGFAMTNDLVGKTLADIFKAAGVCNSMIDTLYQEHYDIMKNNCSRVVEYTNLFSQKSADQTVVYQGYKYPLCDATSKIVGLIGLYVDISKHKNTERSLKHVVRRTKEMFQNIIDALPLMLFWTDKNQIIIGNNIAHAQSFGFTSPEQINGLSSSSFAQLAGIKEQLVEQICKQHDQIMTTKKGQTLEYDVYLYDELGNKKRYDYISYKYPLLDDNNQMIGLIGISADVSDLKETQRALQIANKKAEVANLAKSSFIANLSHDIRAPLSGVVGILQNLFDCACLADYHLNQDNYLSLGHQQNLIANVKHDSHLIVTAVDQLLQLCDEILETINIESGEVTEVDSNFNLHQLINNKINLLLTVANHKKLDLSYEVDDDVPPILKGLANYLSRVILNLLTNALKFTNKGFVRLKVSRNGSVQLNTGDEVGLTIVVEDSGVGIPSDKLDTVFDNFIRLASSTKSFYKSSGLGLNAVKQYIKAMRGSIKVASEVGKGSQFTLSLPFIVAECADKAEKGLFLEVPVFNQQQTDNPKDNHELSMDVRKSSMLTRRILLVEDNPIASLAMKAVLESCQCMVDCAEDGATALTKVKSSYYDVIFMDIGLPDMTGFEVSSRLRSLSLPWLDDVAIIALTGHEDIKEQYLATGINEYLVKPATKQDLRDILQQYTHFYSSKSSNTNLSVNRYNDDSGLSGRPVMNNIVANRSILQVVIDWRLCLEKQPNIELCHKLLLQIVSDCQKLMPKLKVACESVSKKKLQLLLQQYRLIITQLKLPQLERQCNIFESESLFTDGNCNRATAMKGFLNLESALHDLEVVLIQTRVIH